MKDKPIDPIIQTYAQELRQRQTPAEIKLWMRLRERQLGGFRFRRQHPIERYIVDFYCPIAQLVVELDGDSHVEQEQYDQDRTAWLNEHGYRVIRFTNSHVHDNIGYVLEVILNECKRTNQRRL